MSRLLLRNQGTTAEVCRSTLHDTNNIENCVERKARGRYFGSNLQTDDIVGSSCWSEGQEDIIKYLPPL